MEIKSEWSSSNVNEHSLISSYYAVKLSLGGEELKTMVPHPQESRERHSGNIPNTLLLKTLEGCVHFRLFTSCV